MYYFSLVTKTAGKILTVELPPLYLESENATLTTCKPTIIPDITSVVQSQTSSNKNAPLTTCEPTVIPDVTPVVQSQTNSNNDAPLTTSELADAPDVTPVAQSQTSSNNDTPLTTSEPTDVPDVTPAIPPRAPTPLFSPEASLSPRGTDCFDPLVSNRSSLFSNSSGKLPPVGLAYAISSLIYAYTMSLLQVIFICISST